MTRREIYAIIEIEKQSHLQNFVLDEKIFQKRLTKWEKEKEIHDITEKEQEKTNFKKISKKVLTKNKKYAIIETWGINGDMMELEDISDLKSDGRNTVGAHIPLSPPLSIFIKGWCFWMSL